MDSIPRRRTRSTGPARPTGGTRAGRVVRRSASLLAAGVSPSGPEDGGAPALAARPDTGSTTRAAAVRFRVRRATSRPAATRPGSAPSATTGRRFGRLPATAPAMSPFPPVRRSRLALHVAVLGLVFCAVAFVLAVPLRNYLSQRDQLSAATAKEAQMTAQIADLQARKAALLDPAYIRSEARRRLQRVEPGVTVYDVHAPDLPTAALPGRAEPAKQAPWYSNLWDTLADPSVSAIRTPPVSSSVGARSGAPAPVSSSRTGR